MEKRKKIHKKMVQRVKDMAEFCIVQASARMFMQVTILCHCRNNERQRSNMQCMKGRRRK
jgi:hypothetical protein